MAKLIAQGLIDRTRLAGYNRKHIRSCRMVAGKQAFAARSDPFVYDRIMSHLLGGLGLITDYEVSFINEPRVTEAGTPYTVQVPNNQKRI